MGKVSALRARKGSTPIVCLTAYTTPFAKLIAPHVDLILVGDSLGMVLYGMSTTVGVSLDMMIAHGRAVVGAANGTVVIVDLPAGTYEDSPEQALRSARRVMQETGCDGVKLEGGVEMAPMISAITQADIPVMAHIGLMPQSVEKLGGYRVQGRSAEDAARMQADGLAVQAAGAFSVVIECSMEPVAQAITKALDIPTIGIGGSAQCDGQILVSDDMLGLTQGKLPRFVKQYGDIGAQISAAVTDYAQEVQARSFPAPEHLYFPKADT